MMNYQHRSRKRKDKLLSAIENRSEMSRQIKQKLEDSVMRKVNLFIAMSLDGDNIVGGLGVIVNDFHNKKDLTPNVCAYIPKKNIEGKKLQDICCIQL